MKSACTNFHMRKTCSRRVAHLAIKPWMDKAHLWALMQMISEFRGFDLEPLYFPLDKGVYVSA
jgi:hypothetical protein